MSGSGAETPVSPADLRRWLGQLPSGLERIVQSRLAIYGDRFMGNPTWPAAALPGAILAAHRADPERRAGVMAGCILLFLAADLVDDAQDGDLPPDLPWSEAINAGHTLLFGSLAAFSTAVPHGGAAFAAAGSRLAAGQALDLGLDWDSPPDEDLVLAAVRGKAGASMRLYTWMAASACDQAGSAEQWAAVGERAGMAVQLRSDLADLEDPASRDLAARRLTLPLAYGLRRAPETVRPALESGEPSRALAALRKCGAITFARFKIEALILEATDHLEPLGLDRAASERIEAVLRSCTSDPGAP